MNNGGSRGSRAVFWGVLAIFFFGCEQTTTPAGETGDEDPNYPDIGVGCSLVRTSADEWTVICPAPMTVKRFSRPEYVSNASLT